MPRLHAPSRPRRVRLLGLTVLAAIVALATVARAEPSPSPNPSPNPEAAVIPKRGVTKASKVAATGVPAVAADATATENADDVVELGEPVAPIELSLTPDESEFHTPSAPGTETDGVFHDSVDLVYDIVLPDTETENATSTATATVTGALPDPVATSTSGDILPSDAKSAGIQRRAVDAGQETVRIERRSTKGRRFAGSEGAAAVAEAAAVVSKATTTTTTTRRTIAPSSTATTSSRASSAAPTGTTGQPSSGSNGNNNDDSHTGGGALELVFADLGGTSGIQFAVSGAGVAIQGTIKQETKTSAAPAKATTRRL